MRTESEIYQDILYIESTIQLGYRGAELVFLHERLSELRSEAALSRPAPWTCGRLAVRTHIHAPAAPLVEYGDPGNSDTWGLVP